MQGYDVIGDVHGRADLLVTLLEQLGYRRRSGGFVHSERQAIFIGDIIDYGPLQRATLDIIQAMVARGSAQVILGNHEFNAVAFATPDPNDHSRFLRPHSNKNRVQHKAFLAEFADHPQAYQAAISWFKGLPLFIELEGAAFIHAAWSEPLIAQLRPILASDNSLPEQVWLEACQRDSWQYQAIEQLLKGPEVTLPAGYVFNDKHGHQRNDIRAKWWLTEPLHYRELALVPHDQEQHIPTLPISDPLTGFGRDGLVFNGHYWLRGKPSPQSDKVICTDYSGDNKLTAYRWSFEAKPNKANFIQVG
ncbi:metallophosphoesterase [Motilimonas eburnea]|uniref:metallophosphoesterase n=1 Tax=Motilimonas eburnea TaxID=1737488 RepID=UPI001E5C460B|nr:metallophosphoesterase [Motilimonas eburnea]MCE2573584.1 metallophosphoesterase [Motilimonas eburnea]